MNNTKVAVGMSGGVDSSVSAYLLKEQGYDVVGVTLKTWKDNTIYDDNSHKNPSPVYYAKTVCDFLNIKHYVIDCEKDFSKDVKDYFVSEYIAGKTPNPCIICNRKVKWRTLLDFCDSMGIEYVATGHYADIKKVNDRYTISNSLYIDKDQTYALCRLAQDQLKRTLFPLSNYKKENVRLIAKNAGIPVWNKKDSMDICFIPDNDYVKFIEEYGNNTSKKGEFVDTNGKFLGFHKGYFNYTIGQRKGLGVSYSEPLFVTKILPDENKVVLGKSSDIYSSFLYASNLNFMALENITGPINCKAKIRYSQNLCDCRVYKINDDTVKCEFDTPQRAVTPGQSVVFYENGYILLSGIIN